MNDLKAGELPQDIGDGSPQKEDPTGPGNEDCHQSNLPETMPVQTLGEKRIRTTFNPSGSNVIDNVKATFAGLIDLCESCKEKDPRLAATAQTRIEEAAMWMVKLLTA